MLDIDTSAVNLHMHLCTQLIVQITFFLLIDFRSYLFILACLVQG